MSEPTPREPAPRRPRRRHTALVTSRWAASAAVIAAMTAGAAGVDDDRGDVGDAAEQGTSVTWWGDPPEQA